MRDRKDIKNIDIRFYAYIMRKAYYMLKEQEAKPDGKCVNECECWDSAYERGKQDALKEQEAKLPRKITKIGGLMNGICPNPLCNAEINSISNGMACGYCGQEVKWE